MHGDGNCYQIRPEVLNVTWEQAVVYCQSLNATLPSFRNQTDWNNFEFWRFAIFPICGIQFIIPLDLQYLKHFCRQNFGKALNLNTTDFWIGLTKPPNASAAWKWLDGVPFASMNMWPTSFPMVSSNSSDTCVASIASVSNEWQNFDCAPLKQISSLICKKNNIG